MIRKGSSIFSFIYTVASILLSSSSILNCNGYKMLGIFPTPSYSHQQSLLALSKALAARGHEVTILTTDPIKRDIKNMREFDLSWLYDEIENMTKSGVISLQERTSMLQSTSDTINYVTFLTRNILEKYEFHQFLKEVNGTKYDLIIYEAMLYSALLGIRELVGNPPVVGIISFQPYIFAEDPMGNPGFSSSVPVTFSGFDDRMTLWERIQNMYGEIYARYVLHNYILPNHQELLDKYFSGINRTAADLEFDKSLLIVTMDLATGYPKPIQPNTIFVGPLHIKDSPKPLPRDLQKWMDEAKDGVIYFSLGGNMKGTSVPERIRAELIKAFKMFPKIRVLWKWEADTDLPGRPENVLVRKWFPQQSVFAHPKTKVFISHGGQQSFQEAIHYNIPGLAIPIFGDQDFNSRMLLRSGSGLRIELKDITCKAVYEKLKSLICDPRTNQCLQWTLQYGGLNT